MTAPSHVISSIEQLETIYKDPAEPALVKEIGSRHAAVPAAYRGLALRGSRDGGAGGARLLAARGPRRASCACTTRTLMLPDRRGNNRVNSLRNIVRDPRVALLFLIPGSGSTLRVNGRAHLSTDPRCAPPSRWRARRRAASW